MGAKKSNQPLSGSSVPQITQSELADLRELMSRFEAIKKKKAGPRQRPLAAPDGQSHIEPGALRLDVERREVRLICFASYSQLMGGGAAPRLRDEIAPKIHTYVRVLDAECS